MDAFVAQQSKIFLEKLDLNDFDSNLALNSILQIFLIIINKELLISN